MLFNNAGQPKENLSKKLVITGDKLDFLDSSSQNIQFQEVFGEKKAVEIDKLKLSKQFKLVNPVPKF